jgi:integrase
MDPHSNDTVGSNVPVNVSAPLRPVEPDRIHIPGFGSIYRRGGRWAVEFWKGGVQHRESARTTSEQEAIAHLRKRVEEFAQGRYVGARAERVTVADLLKRVTADYANAGNRSRRTLKYRVAALASELGHLRATNVSPSAVEAYKAKRLSEGRAKATINRELACLRRAYRLAERSRPPLISANNVPSIELYREDNVRQVLVDYTDYVALLAHLPAPIDDALTFAYLTGWRRTEALGLTWQEVDRERGLITLPSVRSKHGESRELPLSPALSALIEKRWQARFVSGPSGPHVCERVFHRDGEPVRDFRSAWRKAVQAIGKPGILFHDLRRAALTNLVQSGVGEQVAIRISGHRTSSVFRRYRIVSTDDVLAALTRTELRLTAVPHNSATFPHNCKGNVQEAARVPIRKIVIVRKVTSTGTLHPAGAHSIS